MASLYTHQASNIRKTWVLMGLFLVVVTSLGYTFSRIYGNPGIFYSAIILSLFMNILSYWNSDKIALSLSRAREVKREEYFDFFTVAENLSITAGLPMPKIYVIEDPQPNAFATGRDPEHSAIAATTGLLNTLDRKELEGVIAHEMSHIGNRDTLVMTAVVVLVGLVSILSDIFLRSRMWNVGSNRDRENNAGGILILIGIALAILSPFIATLIQLAISRKREFLADASGALLTRYPEGLASALRKISSYPKSMRKTYNATAHLFISSPFGGDRNNDGVVDERDKSTNWFSNLFLTHPPVEERIAALEGIDRQTN